MATVGHLVTMLGVFAFYANLFESHFEKKTTVYLHTIVARFNKRVNYYVYKIVLLQILSKNVTVLPKADTRNYILKTQQFVYDN